MLKGEDVVLLLKLTEGPSEWTVRALEEETSIPRSVVHRSLKRLASAGLVDERRRRVNMTQAEEFLIHAVRYIFPGVLEGETRGVPTAWAAHPLADLLASPPSELPPVWPDVRGSLRGSTLRPLHDAVVEAARRDPELGQRLALIDAIRLGDARVRGLAADELTDRLRRSPA
jgi:DNA-binding transcriptional ArsR family regulator